MMFAAMLMAAIRPVADIRVIVTPDLIRGPA
ncbi:hypothetical protein FHR22_001604 [Sphingopyxis panaciterrae]|nr:hypothetical protein [Sphingopyxis panaciterrae]